MASPLQSVGLIEKDSNGDVLWVWAYPSIDPAFRELLMRKCTLTEHGKEEEDEKDTSSGLEYSYGHYAEAWYYLLNVSVEGAASKLDKVVSFCITLVTKEFNPEKYHHLLGIFAQSYLNTGNPVSIVSVFLKAYTKGEVTEVPESCKPFSDKNYDKRKAYVGKPLRSVAQIYGIESIIIYNALLLKKKVVVYAPRLDTLLDFCRVLPQFVWHRQNWNIVYPNMSIDEFELEGLQGHGTYVAGFTDPAVEARTDLYDLFVNVAGGSVDVNPESKESFSMTKIHKDIAMRLMEVVNDEEYSEQQVVKELATKTKELLNNLKKLAGDGNKLSIEKLHGRKLTPATENFLFTLASVEGMAQL